MGRWVGDHHAYVAAAAVCSFCSSLVDRFPSCSSPLPSSTVLYPGLGEGGRRAAGVPAKTCPCVQRSSCRGLQGVRGGPGSRSLGGISEAGLSRFICHGSYALEYTSTEYVPGIYFHGKKVWFSIVNIRIWHVSW